MTLSKERLDFYATTEPPFGYTGGDIQAMARELLERRERDGQEPVGYTYNRGINCEIVAADLNTDCPCGIDLYAAPPAPVVPETLLSAMEEVLRISDRQHDAWDKAKAALSACRAAALNQTHVKQPASNGQSFGNSEQLNSPAIPDGWIKCSERLPPEGYEPDGGAVCYLVWNRNEVDCGPQYSVSNVVFLRKHWEKHFTHWQPLPAAPKQESE